MKQTIMLLVVLLLVSCGQRKDGKTTGSQRMTTEVLLKTTPVKNQGHSELCWDYAMLATIETEHLMQGDSVNLSPDYVARRLLEEEGNRLFLTHTGRISPAARPLCSFTS